MAPPLVSLVIPTYQRVALLEETLRSALAQTWNPLEILVQDDGSTDGTEAMVRGLGDARLAYQWAPNHGHPAAVRNRALGRAAGELIAFLDSDDLLLPEALARQVAALQADPTLLAVSCNAEWLPARSHPMHRLAHDVRPALADLLRHNLVVQSGLVARRALFDAVGRYDEGAPRGLEDYDLWLRTLAHRDRSILVRREVLVRYRWHGENIGLRGWDEVRALEALFARSLAASHPGPVAAALAERRRREEAAEALARFRSGALGYRAWLAQGQVPLRRRLRVAARALLGRRGRA
jgi:glycosyltransferase involved in cell wall biosynthesis